MISAKAPLCTSIPKLAIELAADLDRAHARNVERLAVSALIQGDEYKRLMAAMQDRRERRSGDIACRSLK